MSIAEQFPTVAPLPGSDNGDKKRIERGQRIAATTRIVEDSEGWTIPSQSKQGVYYRIHMDENGLHCSCPDAFRTCKHIHALRFMLEREQKKGANNPLLESAPVKLPDARPVSVAHANGASKPNGKVEKPRSMRLTKDDPDYWRTNNLIQINEGRVFPQLLHALCAVVPEPDQHVMGRPPVPLRDLIFGEVYREYANKSSRRYQSAIKEYAEDGYLSKAYTHNKGTSFLNEPETTHLLRALITESARPLQGIERVFAPDSSGFSTSTYASWRDEKHGSARTGATYVKTHIMTGVDSHIITAATASVEPVGDITQLPALLLETRGAHFTVEELVADGAYLSEPMLEWINEMGIDFWVPFRKNSKFHYDGSLWDKHLATFLLNQELFAEHYHERSQVETTFSMVKSKYGASVRGKQPVSQANSVLCKLLANNLYVLIGAIYKIGLEPEFEKIAVA